MGLLSRTRLEAILDRCANLNIGVVGDLGLDAYWYADMTRSFLSRETPRFPRPIVREVYAPGAGANVARNLKVLGVGQVVVFSVLGDDWRGAILRQEMDKADAFTSIIRGDEPTKAASSTEEEAA